MASFELVLWLHSGDIAANFENVVLFASYWVVSFATVVMLDWRGRRPEPAYPVLRGLVELRGLRSRWPAAAALLIGFVAKIPFMSASLIEGPAARALDGADISLPVGFLVDAIVYPSLRGFDGDQTPAAPSPVIE